MEPMFLQMLQKRSSGRVDDAFRQAHRPEENRMTSGWENGNLELGFAGVMGGHECLEGAPIRRPCDKACRPPQSTTATGTPSCGSSNVTFSPTSTRLPLSFLRPTSQSTWS